MMVIYEKKSYQLEWNDVQTYLKEIYVTEGTTRKHLDFEGSRHTSCFSLNLSVYVPKFNP